MFSFLDKIIDKLKITFYKKVDNSLHVTNIDKSTNTTYLSNIPLPPEKILQLPDEELGKYIKEHTMLNFKTAYKDKPEEMKKLIDLHNLSKLSVAGNTITAHNIMPWLVGETTVEPVEPMPSGDFIEQLPNTIDEVIDFDSIEDFDSIGAKMNQEQTYDNCSYFDIHNLCPHRDEELMNVLLPAKQG